MTDEPEVVRVIEAEAETAIKYLRAVSTLIDALILRATPEYAAELRAARPYVIAKIVIWLRDEAERRGIPREQAVETVLNNLSVYTAVLEKHFGIRAAPIHVERPTPPHA